MGGGGAGLGREGGGERSRREGGLNGKGKGGGGRRGRRPGGQVTVVFKRLSVFRNSVQSRPIHSLAEHQSLITCTICSDQFVESPRPSLSGGRARPARRALEGPSEDEQFQFQKVNKIFM